MLSASNIGVGPVALTQNEVFKAQRLAKDYYLYFVWNAGKDPKAEPIIIQGNCGAKNRATEW